MRSVRSRARRARTAERVCTVLGRLSPESPAAGSLAYRHRLTRVPLGQACAELALGRTVRAAE